MRLRCPKCEEGQVEAKVFNIKEPLSYHVWSWPDVKTPVLIVNWKATGEPKPDAERCLFKCSKCRHETEDRNEFVELEAGETVHFMF